MKVRDLININLINLNSNAETKDEVLKEIAKMINAENRLNSEELYYEKLLERERQFSTGVGYGIAIPHAKTDAVKIPTMTIIRLKSQIEWQSIDDKPVSLVIGLAVPECKGNNIHLKIISNLSMKLMDDDFRSSLKNADNEDEILNIMDQVSF
ncbi:PTS sugar transporter subunit IIA [Paramaledivibacter caminithermalis]|jgi:fructose-specific phosphotransferase system IIA component|uniref:PTS system, fructose-specific IIC component n=1 Tax=Paramaledivibacter caminithermalis (strain DSM 15212 / CIP 107654 / DViRD3) TaxID=1121301 RepID=A0A1M6MRU4_PARC5|nr:PTS sugar transporter subunit IIA [Paramaledivibacter caminithermalis]SHJ86110.1 PTS system, fructose-specific IIC component [Paramaledivibacter caminithermalis DSM 15212]